MSAGNGGAGPAELEREIVGLRSEMGDLVGELDRRRREVFDLRLQARRHPLALGLVGLGAALLLGGAVAVVVSRQRHRRRPGYRARQLRAALQRVVEHPELVARGEPPPSEKILTAVGVAAAGILVRRALERAVPPTPRRAGREAGQFVRPATAAPTSAASSAAVSS